MNDEQIYQKVRECRCQGREVALLTLVEARGATPRRAGAKMALLADGTAIGTIGGGCVEARVGEAALAALKAKRSRVVVAELNDPVGQEGGDVCGGKVTVLIEYLAARAIEEKTR